MLEVVEVEEGKSDRAGEFSVSVVHELVEVKGKSGRD